MAKTWILIANASEAFLYETYKAKLFQSNGQHRDDVLVLLKHYQHSASRKRINELVSDREGSFISGGHGSFSEETSPKEVEEQRFAHELAQELECGRIAGLFDELIIIAGPRFQGYLNKHLNSHLNKLLTCHVEKDYTHLKQRELIHQLKQHI